NEITIIQGWNWYAGSDPGQVGSDQYDFETTIIHELGHALGLGHNGDTNSPMYQMLPTGTAHRVMTVTDLNIPDPPSGADPLKAGGFASTVEEASDDKGSMARGDAVNGKAGLVQIASSLADVPAANAALLPDVIVSSATPSAPYTAVANAAAGGSIFIST